MTADFYDAWDKPEPTPRTTGGYTPPSEAQPYAAKALAAELEALANAPQGQRNHQLNESGFSLAQLVAGGYLSHEEVHHALHTTALGIGLTETETLATLRSALGAGAAHPRVVPVLNSEPLSASAYTPGAGVPPGDPQAAEEAVVSLRDRFPALNWHDLWADDTEEEWVLEPLLPARRLVALFSPPKMGKSLLMLEVAVAVSRGVSCLGTTPDRPFTVLYVDFENDPRGDVRTRLQAMGLTPDDLANLKYLSFPMLAKFDTVQGGYELLATCHEYGAEVVVIDTISRAVAGEENDNDTWLAFYRNTGLLLKAAGIATIRLDHTGKDTTKGMRGGSAKYGDVDAVWSLTSLSEDTFRLECTANRLPIDDKVLTFERRTDPWLHHALTSKRTGDLLHDEYDRVIAVLDGLGVPLDHGRGKCIEALNKAGERYTVRHMEPIVRRRKNRVPEATTLPLDGA